MKEGREVEDVPRCAHILELCTYLSTLRYLYLCYMMPPILKRQRVGTYLGMFILRA